MIIVIVHGSASNFGGSAQFFLSRGRWMGPHPCRNESQTRVECRTQRRGRHTRRKKSIPMTTTTEKDTETKHFRYFCLCCSFQFCSIQYYFIILERVAGHCMPRMDWVVPLSSILRNWAIDRYEIVVCRKIKIRTALEGNGTLSTNWSVACSCPSHISQY